jgi:hypothetical protein
LHRISQNFTHFGTHFGMNLTSALQATTIQALPKIAHLNVSKGGHPRLACTDSRQAQTGLYTLTNLLLQRWLRHIFPHRCMAGDSGLFFGRCIRPATCQFPLANETLLSSASALICRLLAVSRTVRFPACSAIRCSEGARG